MSSLLQFTIYSKTLIFLSFVLFLQGYLFENLLPCFCGVFILIFLVYSKLDFKENIGEPKINRKILEKQRFVNHPVNVKTIIKNKNGPLNIHATDVLPVNSEVVKGDNSKENLILSDEEMTLDYQIEFNTRGSHCYNFVDLTLKDKLGLYYVEARASDELLVMVHSDPKEVQKAKRVSGHEHIEITMPSMVGTENIYELEGIRDYTPGDRLKDVEWKATSRLQRLMTKLFEKKEVVDTIILLDCSSSMRRTVKKRSKIDHATNLAVHLTRILQSLRHHVGLIAFDEYKIIKNITPTDNYHTVFESLTDLPGQIKTTGYQTIKPFQITEVKDNPIEHQRFISTVFPFLARGKRTVKHSSQATGIFESIRLLLMDNKNKHIVIITDLETNIQSLYRSIILAHARKYKIWLLTSFSPFYNLNKKQLNTEQLENIYKLYTSNENMLRKLRKMNIEIVELTPSMEGGKIIEKIRRR